MEVFNLLSKYHLNRVLDREPWLLNHFCMEKVLELKPPPEALGNFLSFHLCPGIEVRDESTLVLQRFYLLEELFWFLEGIPSWRVRIEKLDTYSSETARAFIRYIKFKNKDVELVGLRRGIVPSLALWKSGELGQRLEGSTSSG